MRIQIERIAARVFARDEQIVVHRFDDVTISRQSARIDFRRGGGLAMSEINPPAGG